jgi:hypothetical protein
MEHHLLGPVSLLELLNPAQQAPWGPMLIRHCYRLTTKMDMSAPPSEVVRFSTLWIGLWLSVANATEYQVHSEPEGPIQLKGKGGCVPGTQLRVWFFQLQPDFGPRTISTRPHVLHPAKPFCLMHVDFVPSWISPPRSRLFINATLSDAFADSRKS